MHPYPRWGLIEAVAHATTHSVRTYIECIPCMFRQAIDAARLAGADESVQKQIVDGVAALIPSLDIESPPPNTGRKIHGLVRSITGMDDPYFDLKERSTRLALKMYPVARRMVDEASDPMATAVALAIAGNIIDYGIPHHDPKRQIQDIVNHIADPSGRTLGEDLEPLRVALDHSREILYIGDNTGETVFDRVLIEEILHRNPSTRVRFAVRSRAILNDALRHDAIAAGIAETAEIVESGADGPGTFLDSAPESFLRLFGEADLIIAKGQGNYESLSDVDAPLWFLLMAKCEVIARHIGCEVGDTVLMKARRQ